MLALPQEPSMSPGISILLGEPGGHFQAPFSVGAGGGAYAIAAGDFLPDGYADLAVGRLGYNTVTVVLNLADWTGPGPASRHGSPAGAEMPITVNPRHPPAASEYSGRPASPEAAELGWFVRPRPLPAGRSPLSDPFSEGPLLNVADPFMRATLNGSSELVLPGPATTSGQAPTNAIP
jgi:hypothetical protein